MVEPIAVEDMNIKQLKESIVMGETVHQEIMKDIATRIQEASEVSFKIGMQHTHLAQLESQQGD